MKTRLKQTIIYCAAGLFLLMAAAVAGLYIYLPTLLQDRLLPQLAQKLGLTPEQIQVRRIALTMTDLGPIRLSAAGRPTLSADTIRLRYSPLSLLQGRIERLAVIGLSLEIVFSDNGVSVAGIQRSTRLERSTTWPRQLESMLPISLQHITLQNALVNIVRGDQALAIPLSAEIDASALRQGRLEGKFQLRPLQSRIDISVHMDTRQNKARLDLSQMHAMLEKYAQYLPDLPELPDLRMAATIDADGRAECRLSPFELTDLDFSALLDDLKAGRAGFQMELPRIELSGTYQSRAKHVELQAHAPRIRLNLPDGQVHAQEFKLAGDGSLDLSGPMPTIGILATAELAGLSARNASVEMTIPLLNASSRWIQSPGLPLSMHGEMHFSNAVVTSSGLKLDGITAGVQFNNIFDFRTAPGQRVHIKEMQLGTINASDLAVAFQIKGPDRIVIEQAEMDWCDGTIRTGGIELSAGNDKIDAILIGEDLDPVMLLEQVGVARGTGHGSVSGRIPFSWTAGRLRFNNGKLASPPGQSGSLQLERLGGSEYLQSGLPEGTPQRAQLDIAIEALKDYTYEQIELQLESEEEILLLRLRLNGKPNRLLPFKYDAQAGKFTRTKGEGLAEFKGIDIDLNFRSPLDEILRYRELLKGD